MHQVRETQANVPPQQELQTEHEVPQALQGVHLQYLPVLQQPHPIPCQTPQQEGWFYLLALMIFQLPSLIYFFML